MQGRIEAIANATQGVLTDYTAAMKQVASEGYERIVYLGSHIFQGLARESGLKLLELTNGGTGDHVRFAAWLPPWPEDHRQQQDPGGRLFLQQRLYPRL